MIMRLFKARNNHHYPLMRDPKRNPKCYEMTDKEREEALQKVEQLLKDREQEQHQGYYGA